MAVDADSTGQLNDFDGADEAEVVVDRLTGSICDDYTELANNVVISGAEGKANIVGGRRADRGVGVGDPKSRSSPGFRQLDHHRRQRFSHQHHSDRIPTLDKVD